MSEVVNKPAEEPVVAPAAVIEPVPEVKTVEEPSTETPAVTEPSTETPVVAEEAAKEPEPFAEEGILKLKGPGFVDSILGSKKFFWFGSDPIDEKSLSKEPATTVAWASHTGKGLLLFSKTAAEKATPSGVINLSEISEVTTKGEKGFHFTAGKETYKFEATSAAEKDNWVSALNTKAAEAKELAPTVTEHEAYKSKLEALKPTVAAVAPVVTPKEEKAEAKEEKKDDKVEKKAEKEEEKAEKKETKKRTSRSASRKRTSIFGAFGKKDEAKKEEVTEAAPVAPEADAAPVEATPAVVEPVVPAAEETAAAPVEEAPVAETKPAASKRNSFFGTLSSKLAAKKDAKSSETEAAPAVPAKDAGAVSETAPVIPAVETTEPLAASTLTPATVPAETVTNGEEAKAVETPAAVKDKRKSSLPWLSSKKDKSATTSDDDSEKPKSPFSGLRNTFKKAKSPKTPTTESAASETPAATEETPAVPEAPVAEEAKAEEPVVSEPVSAAPVASTPVAASA